MSEYDVVIVGAGPCGMTLAYLLAQHGKRVRVLERHPDFKREFRGELIQPHVLQQLDELGVAALLRERGHALFDVQRQMFLGHARKVGVPGGDERGALVWQPGLLQILHEKASEHAGYSLAFDTTVTGTIKQDGRVVGVQTKHGEERGKLVVVTNGRNSALRGDVGLAVENFAHPTNALWLRFDFSDMPDALPGPTLEVHMFGKSLVVVHHATANQRLQIAYSANGDLAALREPSALKEALLPHMPESLRAPLEKKIDSGFESQILRIVVDRLSKWHAPGVLFLGDAAHTMSPSGGQGLNVAIRDAIVAANHLRDGAGDDVLQQIEAERVPEIVASQEMQVRAGLMVLKPLPVLHMMFSVLGVVMKLNPKLREAQKIVPIPIRRAV